MPKGKRQSMVDPNETKGAKFVRLANGRVNAAWTALDRLGKLNTSAYERTADQVEKLRKIMLDKTNEVCDGLLPRSGGSSAKSGLGNVL